MYLIQEYRAQFQNVNKKKILVLNPSSRVGFERPFKTASSELKKNQNWTVSLRALLTRHNHHQNGEDLLVVRLRSDVAESDASHTGHCVVERCHVHTFA